MGFSNAQTIARWGKQVTPRGCDTPRGRSGGGNVYYQGRMLYSYRESWPLAKLFTPATPGTPDGLKGKLAFGITNGERFSNSTARHLSATRSTVEGPQVPLSALDRADIPFKDLEAENILDWSTGETVWHLVRVKGQGYFSHDYVATDPAATGAYTYNPWTPPAQGMFMVDPSVSAGGNGEAETFFNVPSDDIVVGYWHRLGGTLIEWQGRRFLSGLDEGMAFLIRLIKGAKPTTLAETVNALKPEPVRKAEAQGLAVKRQGEWFFIPTTFTNEDIQQLIGATSKTQARRYASRRALPVTQGRDSNRHVCSVATMGASRNGHIHEVDQVTRRFVVGNVVHKWPPRRGELALGAHFWRYSSRGTREHAKMALGDVWHEVYRAVDDGSWSAQGKVD